MHSVDFTEEDRPRSAGHAEKLDPAMSNTVKLEFSNYAQVDIKRTGAKSQKRYEFEYWGISYAWRRINKSDERSSRVSFVLVRSGNDQPLASIVPVQLSRSQAYNERKKGGWIPPCAMWISDNRIIHSQKDVSE